MYLHNTNFIEKVVKVLKLGGNSELAFTIDSEIGFEEPNEKNTPEGKENDEIKSIHYISWMFGILFTCGLVSLITIIPHHNILKEPDYWYEAMIEGDLSVPILSALIIFNGAYWANISYLKNWTSFLKLIIIGTSTFTLSFVSYHWIWTYQLKFSPPVAYGYYVAGTNTFISFFAILWFR